MNIPTTIPANTTTVAAPTTAPGASDATPVTDIFAALLGGLSVPVAVDAGAPELATDREPESVAVTATEPATHDGSDISETALAMSQFAAMFNSPAAIPNPPATAMPIDAPSEVDIQGASDTATSLSDTPDLTNTVEPSAAPPSPTLASAPHNSALASAPTAIDAKGAADAANTTTPTMPPAATTQAPTNATSVATAQTAVPAVAPKASDQLSKKPRINVSADAPTSATATSGAVSTDSLAASAAIAVTATPPSANPSVGIADATASAVADASLPKTPGRAKLKMVEVETNPAVPATAINPDEQILAAAAQASTRPTPTAAPATSKSGDDTTAINATAANAHSATLQARPPITATGPESTNPTAPLAPATQQVLDAIEPMAQRADGSYHLKLSLNPHNLGRVELSIELHDGVLAVHMAADRPETQRALTEQLSKLREILDARGVSMGSLDVGDHSSRNAFSAQAQTQDRNSSSRRNPTSANSATTVITALTEVPRIARQSPSTNLLDVHA